MKSKDLELQQLEEQLAQLTITNSELKKKNMKKIKQIESAVSNLTVYFKYLLFERDALERERDFWIEQAIKLGWNKR